MLTYYHRNIETQLLNAIREFPVLVLTGARQTGKSTLLKTILADYEYITLDDPLQRQLIQDDPKSFLDQSEKPVIIDEIQYAPGILHYIKILVDEQKTGTGHFVLTGSQHFNLMANVTESLAGRAAVMNLPTFSITENNKLGIHSREACFEAIFRGFYPVPFLNQVNIPMYYGSYIQTYLERDVRQISNVSDLNVFQLFLSQLAARSGSILNLNDLARECGIAFNTAKKWLSILQASGIISLLKPYFSNIPKRLIKSPKIYINDTGLMAYILKYQNPQSIETGPLSGQFFETFIINEFIKYRYNNQANFDMYFFRDSNRNELDLILEYSGKYLVFEIKASQTVHLDHLRKMKKILPVFKDFRAYLLGFYQEDSKLEENIMAVNWKNIFSILDENFLQ